MKNRFQRIVSLLLVVAMLAALPVAASADGVKVTHQHKFKETKTARGCLNPETILYECTVNGCTYSYTVQTAPSFHDFPNEVNGKDVTGGVEYRCKTCDTLLFSKTSDCVHHYNQITTPATCLAKGTSYEECEICGHKQNFQLVNMLSHDYDDWCYTHVGGVEPTAMTDGVAVRKCSKCGNIESAPVPRAEELAIIVSVNTTKDATVYSTNTNYDVENEKEIIGYLQKGTEVDLVGTAEEAGTLVMVKIKADNKTAWVKTDALDLGSVTTKAINFCSSHNYVTRYTHVGDCDTKTFVTEQCTVCGILRFSESGGSGHKWDSGRILDAEKPTDTDIGYKRYYCLAVNANGEYIHSDPLTKSLDTYVQQLNLLTTAEAKAHSGIKMEELKKVAETSKLATVKNDGAKVYDGSSTTAALKGYLNKDTEVTVYGETSDGSFYLIDKQNGYWIAAADLNTPVSANGTTLSNCGSHSYKTVYERAATCDERGYVTKKCAKCDVYTFDYTNALGHEWSTGHILEKDGATATAEGTKRYYCIRKGSDGKYIHSGIVPSAEDSSITSEKTGDEKIYFKDLDALRTKLETGVDAKLCVPTYTFIKTESVAKNNGAYQEADVVITTADPDAPTEDSDGYTRLLACVYKGYDDSKKVIGYAPNGAHFTVYRTATDAKGNLWYCMDETNSYWIPAAYVGNVKSVNIQTSCTHISSRYKMTFDASCEYPVFTTTFCAKCGRITLAQGTTVLGHKWSEWTTTKEPTETDTGLETRTCERKGCGETEVRTIDKLEPAKVGEAAHISGGDIVKIYDGADTKHTVTGYATKGATLTLLAFNTDGTWVQVQGTKADGKTAFTGWVRRADITLGAAVNVASPYAGAAEYGDVPTGNSLKVYEAPRMTAAYKYSLAEGSPIAGYQYYDDTKATGSQYSTDVPTTITDQIWMRISATEQLWVRYDLAKKKDSKGVYNLLPVGMTQHYDAHLSEVDPNAVKEDAVAEGRVTATKGLTVRSGAGVSYTSYGYLPYTGTDANDVILYEIKTVSGVEWGRIKRDTKVYDSATKAEDLTWSASSNTKSGWVCLTYVSYELVDKKPVEPVATYTTGTVSSTTALNVRKSPNVYGDKIGALQHGTKVTIYDTKTTNNVEWGQINQNNLNGWICLMYVDIDAAASSGSSSVVATVNATVANCSTGVNVRVKADVKSAQVAKIPVGTRVAITKKENGWGYVDGKGWVYLQYVNFDAGAEQALDNPGSSSSSASTDLNPVKTYTAVAASATVIADNVSAYKMAGGMEKYSGTQNPVVMTLYKGKKVSIVDRTLIDGLVWYKISGNAWVKEDGQLKLDEVTGTTTTTVDVHDSANIDSPISGTLGAGSKVYIQKQSTDGIYAWGQLSTNGWIRMDFVTADVTTNSNFVPSYSTYPTITGVVTSEAPVYEDTLDTTPITKMASGASITVQDWKCTGSGTTSDPYITWGKVSCGGYTGWIVMAKVGKNVDEGHVEINQISGTVTADALNLYKSCTGTDLAKTIRTGEKVTVTEIRLVKSAVWGRMVCVSDTTKQELWANLAGVLLNGQTAASSATTTTTTTPETATTTVTTVQIGVVTGAKSVNVRSQPHVSSALVTTLPEGTTVSVSETTVSDGATWGHIDQGWIAMTYVDVSGYSTVGGTGVTTGTTLITSVPTGAIGGAYATANNLAAHATSSLSSATTGYLSENEPVVVYEQVNTTGGGMARTDKGWVSTQYLVYTCVGNTGTSAYITGCYYTANARASAGTGNTLTAKVLNSASIKYTATTTYSGQTWYQTAVGWIVGTYVQVGTMPLV